MVNLKTKSADDGYPKKAIEKTILRFLVGLSSVLRFLRNMRTEGWIVNMRKVLGKVLLVKFFGDFSVVIFDGEKDYSPPTNEVLHM